MRSHESLNLATIHFFKWFKISNIKKLKKIKRMNRYIKSQNIVIFVINLKSIRMMTLMAVKNKKSIYTLRARFCVLIKMFYLIHTQLIIYLIVIINSNLPIAKDYRVFVPKKKVIFCLDYDEQRDCSILRICFLNDKNPFLITKLS